MSGTLLGPRELARLTGVSTDTLRHYERIGLLDGTGRTAAGYRRYPAAAADRVRLIQRAMAAGFSLKDLAQTFAQCHQGDAPCRRVRAFVGERLGDLDTRIAGLIALREELKAVLDDWDDRLAQTPVGHRARLLDMLTDRPALQPARTPLHLRVGRQGRGRTS